MTTSHCRAIINNNNQNKPTDSNVPQETIEALRLQLALSWYQARYRAPPKMAAVQSGHLAEEAGWFVVGSPEPPHRVLETFLLIGAEQSLQTAGHDFWISTKHLPYLSTFLKNKE